MGSDENDGKLTQMRIRPDILDILELSRHIINNQFDDDSYENRRYETFMMANAITIALRQLKIGNGPEREELASLLNLMDANISRQSSIKEDLSHLYSQVCKEIRKGNFDPDKEKHEKLRAILDKAALQSVTEYNPKYISQEE